MFVQDLVAPSIKQEQEAIEEKPPAKQIVVVVLAPSSDWRQPFIRYPTTTDVLANNIERECLTRRSKHYASLMGGWIAKTPKASYYRNVSPWKKVRRYLRRSMQAPVTTMPPLEH